MPMGVDTPESIAQAKRNQEEIARWYAQNNAAPPGPSPYDFANNGALTPAAPRASAPTASGAAFGEAGPAYIPPPTPAPAQQEITKQLATTGGASFGAGPTPAPPPQNGPAVSGLAGPTSAGFTPAPSAGGSPDIGTFAKGLDWSAGGAAGATDALRKAQSQYGWTNDQIGASLGFTGQQMQDHFNKYPATGSTINQATKDYFAKQPGGSNSGALYTNPQTGMQVQPIYSQDQGAGGEGGQYAGGMAPLQNYVEFAPGKNKKGDPYKIYDPEGKLVREGVFKDDNWQANLAMFLATAFTLGAAGAAGSLGSYAQGGAGAAAGAGGSATAATAAAAGDAFLPGAIGVGGSSLGAAPLAGLEGFLATGAGAGAGSVGAAGGASGAAGGAAAPAASGGLLSGIKGQISSVLAGLGMTGKDAAALAGVIASSMGGGSSGGGGGGTGGAAGGMGSTYDVNGPAGSLNWSIGPDGRLVQNTNLSPGNQSLYSNSTDKLNQTVGGINPSSKAPDLITDAGGNYSKALQDAIYKRVADNLTPERDQALRALETRLAERGFSVQNQGYKDEMDRFEKSWNTRFQDAAAQAQIQASTQALNEGKFTNDARMTGFNANEKLRQDLITQLAGLRNNATAGTSGLTGGAPDALAWANRNDALGQASNQSRNDLIQQLIRWGLT